MELLQIQGGRALEGTLALQGAKNSVLPLLAATLVCPGQSLLLNCPALGDVDVSLSILEHLGCRTHREGHAIAVDAAGADRWDIPDELMGRMRSSVIFLGSILARFGQAELSRPGGCALGARPIDLHLSALEALGYSVQHREGRILCRAERLRGCRIHLPFPSVGATENVLLAALACPGETELFGAAREPEIEDLADLLRAMGARIQGAGTERILIQGKPDLHPAECSVRPDRIAAATWLAAAAATAGQVRLTRADPRDLQAVIQVYQAAGCRVSQTDNTLTLTAPARLTAPDPIVTAPHPGFPTDAQPVVMASLLRARGTTLFDETIFESRYRHVPELQKLGAQITLQDRQAQVEGTQCLFGAQLTAPDLRGGAGLIIAALSAQGQSILRGLVHVDRGYESIERTLQNLGAAIIRLDIP